MAPTRRGSAGRGSCELAPPSQRTPNRGYLLCVRCFCWREPLTVALNIGIDAAIDSVGGGGVDWRDGVTSEVVEGEGSAEEEQC